MVNLKKLPLIILALYTTTGCSNQLTTAASSSKPTPTISPLSHIFATVKQTSDREIHIAVGHFMLDESIQPPQVLSAALKKYPKANTFKIRWEISVASLGTSSMLVYDRAKCIVDYREISGFGDIKRKVENIHHRYTNVSDSVLHKLAKDFIGSGGGPDAGFLRLQEYGCGSQDLSQKSNA